ncbi:MAG TPA: amino acid adenylation domain-containing protein, partial [Candidatus Deferrimicrobium sp.]|nr:amino acid adenylation domain-containing protein [Candidatus Deferrimicrobium sp.]
MKKLDRNNIEEILALTPVQEGMLFHYLKEPDSDYYFEQLCLDIAGAIDTGLFEKAWDFVIDTNEILRTVFRWEKIKNPSQVILKKQPLQWSFYDFADMEPDERAQRLEDIKSQDRQNRFDLLEVPFRVTLCKTGSERHFMIVSFHHMLLDGWSTGIVMKEFLKAYAGLEAGIGPAKPHKTPFKEFIKWRRPGDPEKEEKNWQNYLAGVEPVMLSIKKEHTVNESFIPGNTRVCFDAAQTERLEQFVATNRLTLAALFYCAWGILLQQYNNTDDAIFGTTVSGRPSQLEGSAEMVGLFINTIPLRIRFFTDENLLDLLHRVQISLLDREPFEHSSLLKIREYCHLKSNETLFDSIVALENYPLDAALSEGTGNRLAILSYAMTEATHYDLSLGITLFKEIQCHFQYRKEILEEEAVRRLAGYFTRIVEELVEKPFNKVIQIEILSEEEKKRLLIDFNDTEADYPGTKTVPGLFAEQLERTPDRIALVGADSQIWPQTCLIALSYNELNRQSDRLAGLLIEKGARPGTIVGIMMKRSPGLITGIFGILKIGGAYLPIDPEYPQERVDYMLKDSGAKILITDDEKKKMINCQLLIFNYELLMGNSEVFFHHSSFIIHHSKPSLAYIIYTSGSTGKPKGVLVAHRSLVNLCMWHNRVFEVNEKDRASQYASPGFDASVWEIFPYLLKGAALYIINDELKLDMAGLNHYFEMHHITLAFLPTQICEQFMQVSNRSLRILLTGGDKLHMFTPRSYILYNNYGPTEGTVVTSSYRVENWSYNIPIGRPTANNHIYILHKNGITLQPIGVPGELYIAGAGLALGYLNNIELTAGRFKFNRSYGSYRAYISYSTGDLARWLHDGNIEYLGRIDQQVKIRGFRIELGEIENGLRSHPGINEAVVLAEKNAEGEHCLRAYIVGDPGSSAQLKEYLSRLLPVYMIPAHFQAVQNIPLTPSGKIDRRALASSGETLNPGTEYIAPQSAVEKTIAQVWRDVLGVENVGIHDQFFDRGGNSVSIIRLSSRLSQVLKKNIPVATLFNHPTIASLVDYLVPPTVKKGPTDIGSDSPKNFHPIEIDETVEIAVIGMAGRFPGAKNIDRFWDNLKNGVEGITFFSREELQEMDVNPAWLDNPDYVYVPAKGVLPGHDRFDAYFFGYTPAEAKIMDPQVRIFHECVWEALENAGYDPGTYGGAIGLFAGASPNPFWEVLPLRSMGSGDGKDYPGLWNAIQFSDKDYLSTRVAYKLDLRGPCVTLQTACSTSLTAVDQACRNLLGRACHIALAGGVSVTLHDEAGYLYQEGTIMSPDGHCRAFDSRAQGTVGGNGAGVVVLKRLREAIADGDRIMAVIKGLGISNDGKNKVGFTAPSSEGQAAAIRAAVNMAGFPPQSIGYIETHGTGTPLGDPIEIEGLKKAFNSDFTGQTKSCALGSVKTNIGHLDAAAGIAGFIKTILTLYHRMIPPSLNFERPNPALDLENSPFYVNTVLKTWERCEFPLRAGVSAFGLGGTNVHVILEEYAPGGQEPFYKKVRHFGPPKIFYYLMSLSAATPSALEQLTANLARYFKQNPGIDPADAAYTLQVGRKAFKYRRMLVCSNLQDAVQRITAGETESGAAASEKSTIIFMFSGQGSQYVNMGLDLYRHEPVFRDLID